MTKEERQINTIRGLAHQLSVRVVWPKRWPMSVALVPVINGYIVEIKTCLQKNISTPQLLSTCPANIVYFRKENEMLLRFGRLIVLPYIDFQFTGVINGPMANSGREVAVINVFIYNGNFPVIND